MVKLTPGRQLGGVEAVRVSSTDLASTDARNIGPDDQLQLVEHMRRCLGVVGSSPMVGDCYFGECSSALVYDRGDDPFIYRTPDAKLDLCMGMLSGKLGRGLT